VVKRIDPAAPGLNSTQLVIPSSRAQVSPDVTEEFWELNLDGPVWVKCLPQNKSLSPVRRMFQSARSKLCGQPWKQSKVVRCIKLLRFFSKKTWADKKYILRLVEWLKW
jgi:hypothetical protein